MATALNLESIFSLVDAELNEVRAEVLRHWTEAYQLVYGPTATPPDLGGKMMRPALTLLSAGAVGAERISHYVPMAAAMELLHLAALAHDDVVDRSDTRRGERSLNARWTNHMAVLGGDYLVARALSVLTHYDSCKVVESALESIHDMAEGELINFGKGPANLDEVDCIRLAQKKTASLFAVSCATPSILCDNHHRDALHAYGMGLGTAFQLVDDLLDLEQDPETLGKPVCGDVAEGKLTIPILYLRDALGEDDRERFDALHGSTLDEEECGWIRSLVRESGTKERTEELARTYLSEADAALTRLPASPYRDAMDAAAEFVLIRRH